MDTYDPKVLQRIQNFACSMVTDLSAACEKHGIQFFGICGTALGAVRHGGFIPWDDDIDLGILRADYDRLKEIFDEELGDRYYLLEAQSDPHFPLPTCWICRKGTRFIQDNFKDLQVPLGIYLDIYVMDNLPDAEWLRKWHTRKVWFISKLMILRGVRKPFLYQKGLLAQAIWLVCGMVHDAMKAAGISPEKLAAWYLKEATRYNKKRTKRVGFCADTGPFWHIYDREQTFPLKKLPFADIEIPFPKEPEPSLHNYFGDHYMQLPPVDKRHAHKPAVLDFGDGRGDVMAEKK